MKKFWSLMLVALVTLGAAACTENSVNENNGQEEQSAGLSFYATIGDDTTRAYIDDTDGNKVWDTIWELGDELMVGNYLFVCTDAATGKFTCEDKNAAELIGQSVRITTEGTKHVRDSRAGKGAFYISNSDVMFDQDANIQLTSETSFFRYTYNGEGNVTLKLEISGTDATTPFMDGENAATEITFSGKGEVFVPFWCDADSSAGISATLSYSIDGVKCKEITKEFAAGKVYNLGEFKAPAKIWLLGDWNDWSKPLYMFEEGDYYVAKKVKIESGQGFKFNDGTLYLGGNSTAGSWNHFNGNNITLDANTYDIYISKTNGAWCAVTAGSSAPALNKRYLYLKPGVWDQASAKFQAWCMGTGNSVNKNFAWICYENSANYYVLDISAGYTSFYIKRLSSDYKNTWNEVGEVKIGSNSLVTITGWTAYKLGSLIP